MVATGFIAAIAYIGLAGGAFGPASDDLGDMGRTGSPIFISAPGTLAAPGALSADTGKVDPFATISFTGPNRAQKTARYRPEIDPLTLSRGFDDIRAHLASLRRPEPVAVAARETEKAPPSVDVAAIDPHTAAALDAIAGLAPHSGTLNEPAIPLPVAASEQLAYARADAPTPEAEVEIETDAEIDEIKVSDAELNCLATAIYFEARGEVYRGQVAVAQVVMNRVKDHRYPETICGVVFQNQHRRNACQFSFACDGTPEAITEPEPWKQAQDIARRFVKGELYLTEVGDSTHYHASYVRPTWAPRMVKVTKIGLHIFYKFKRGWLFG